MNTRDSYLENVFVAGTQVAYRRHRNLRDILCSSTLYPLIRQSDRIVGWKICGNCISCTYSKNARFFKCTASGKRFEIQHNITCSSYNIIYLITCNKCYLQYVGKSSNQIRNRMNQHRYDIIDKTNTLGEHFSSRGHSLSDFHFIAIEQVFGDEFIVGERERYWINKLKAIQHGLNKYRTNWFHKSHTEPSSLETHITQYTTYSTRPCISGMLAELFYLFQCPAIYKMFMYLLCF